MVFCERTWEGAGMSSTVPLQESGLRAIPDRIPVLCHDVTGWEAWPRDKTIILFFLFGEVRGIHGTI